MEITTTSFDFTTGTYTTRTEIVELNIPVSVILEA